ncbi:hypothetical protein GCM10011351_04090 [Paraliobacillus quinghaiensis]|uniref:Flagellar hook-length control protein-like C-terminal domain-containing protein n=1 Tax=Paraliobacillus quinghaiensis TaxID=470815 RepID=A0A917WQU1_9BACI|nr:flagellar hook-length control protein FliK [Paraliobacillus quinghaiensis]GGM21417.1 hypothetical protein GCM10011351_04090 [Paraliobacillus quinghaiensis]
MNVAALMNQQTAKVEKRNLNNNTTGQSPFGNLLKGLENKITDSLRESPPQLGIREKLTSVKENNETNSLLKALVTSDQLSLKQVLQQLEVNQDSNSFTAQTNQDVLTKIAAFSSLLTEVATDNQKLDEINNLSNKELLHGRLLLSENHTLSDVDLETLTNQLRQVIRQISTDQTGYDSEGETIQLLQQLESLAEKSNMPEEAKQLKKLVSLLPVDSDEKEQNNLISKSSNDIALDHIPLADLPTLEHQKLDTKEMTSLKEEIGQLIRQVSVNKPANDAVAKVMELLEQWATLTEIPPQETLASTDTKGITSVENDSVKQILSQISREIETQQEIPSDKLINQLESLERLLQVELKAVNNNQLTRLPEIENLWKQISQVLEVAGQLENDSNVKVLKLLEQWSSLEKAAPKEVANLLTQKQTTPEGQLWSRLLQTYQKRADGQMQSKYQSSAMVTTTDVSKWIKNAVSRITSESDQPKTASFVENFQPGQSISKLEQFVVHMKQAEMPDQKAMENQLMEQFQKVIKSSKFMTGPNGSNQLLIKLNPNQLGDISVKLTQLNGEMIVKIAATTQAAKEALESNLQQLRHMFSPSQVVVEKQDAQSFAQAQDEWNDSFDDQMSQSREQEDSERQEHEDPDKEQDLSFEQVLMNERV